MQNFLPKISDGAIKTYLENRIKPGPDVFNKNGMFRIKQEPVQKSQGAKNGVVLAVNKPNSSYAFVNDYSMIVYRKQI
jgi:hypothetical protein